MLSDGQDTFRTAEQKYYSASCNRHLSTLYRMENDYGSVRRDREERNLNMVDFPEFFAKGCDTSEEEQKAQLLRLAQYERESYKDALNRMDTLIGRDAKMERKMQILKVMTNVTDSWGQMYVFKDLGRTLSTITEANDQQLSGQWKIPPNDTYKRNAEMVVGSVNSTVGEVSSRDVSTTFNYFLDSPDGSPPEPLDVLRPPKVPRMPLKKDAVVHDIRGTEDKYTLDEHGFQLVKHTSVEKEFLDEDLIKGVYYREVEELLKKV
jgi:hypothetical protein